mmetsp:Transcript_36570/g.44708  ORF Transcript_36570/g.44708 Transcript_36570/m.44708 type:complete len:102 (+) Transcript_36570:556-861(+)
MSQATPGRPARWRRWRSEERMAVFVGVAGWLLVTLRYLIMPMMHVVAEKKRIVEVATAMRRRLVVMRFGEVESSFELHWLGSVIFAIFDEEVAVPSMDEDD